MGNVLMAGGGGGADTSVVTAASMDVAEGKVIVDKEGEPLSGGIKFSQSTVGDGDVLTGKRYIHGDHTVHAGSMPAPGNAAQNAVSARPSGAADGSFCFFRHDTNKFQVIPKFGYYGTWDWGKAINIPVSDLAAKSYTPSTSVQEIPAGKYLTGKQTINPVKASVLNASGTYDEVALAAKYIPKGVKIAGIAGTFEGYVASATQFYNKGNNAKSFAKRIDPAGWWDNPSSYWTAPTFNTAEITLSKESTYPQVISSGSAFNFSGYSHVKITGRGFGSSDISSDMYGKIVLALVADNKSCAQNFYDCINIKSAPWISYDDDYYTYNYRQVTWTGDSNNKAYKASSWSDTQIIFDINFQATKYMALTIDSKNLGKNPAIYTIEVY